MLGGAAGTAVRYAVWRGWPPPPAAFPWATFAVNVAGCLVLGVVLALLPPGDPRQLRELLVIGFCGGLTTFSTFGLEVVALGQQRSYGLAAVYVVLSIIVGVVAVAAGLWMGTRLARGA